MTTTDTTKPTKPTAKERPIFIVRLRPLPDVDPTYALRLTLKTAWRNHGLQALSCEEEIDHATTTSSSSHA
jgi:hypothetical protein